MRKQSKITSNTEATRDILVASYNERRHMASTRKENDVTLDFRRLDFSVMSEKGLPDPHLQPKPIKLLVLFRSCSEG